MRLAIVVNVYPQASQTFIRTQFQGLLAAGVDCHIVDKAITPRSDSRADVDGGRVHRLTVATRRGYPAELAARSALTVAKQPRRTLKHLRSTMATRRPLVGSHWLSLDRLSRLAPDVVHYSFASYAVGDEHVPGSLGIPFVVSCRGFDLTNVGTGDDHFYHPLWAAVDFVHFRSEDLLDVARQRGFDDSTPHAVTPPGIDADYFSPAHTSEERRSTERPHTILSVGRLVKKKGHEVGLAVIRQLLDRGCPVRYDIVGDGDLAQELKQEAERLQVAHVTRFLGEVTPDRVRDLMRQADVLLHPSWQEGFGVSVLEAQSVGLPVVCTDAEGLPQNVDHGVTGFVVRRGDVAALTNRVQELLDDPDRAKEAGKAGRRRVVDRFSIDREIQSYVDSYNMLLANG